MIATEAIQATESVLVGIQKIGELVENLILRYNVLMERVGVLEADFYEHKMMPVK